MTDSSYAQTVTPKSIHPNRVSSGHGRQVEDPQSHQLETTEEVTQGACFCFFEVWDGRSSSVPWAKGQRAAGSTQPSGW